MKRVQEEKEEGSGGGGDHEEKKEEEEERGIRADGRRLACPVEKRSPHVEKDASPPHPSWRTIDTMAGEDVSGCGAFAYPWSSSPQDTVVEPMRVGAMRVGHVYSIAAGDTGTPGRPTRHRSIPKTG